MSTMRISTITLSMLITSAILVSLTKTIMLIVLMILSFLQRTAFFCLEARIRGCQWENLLDLHIYIYIYIYAHTNYIYIYIYIHINTYVCILMGSTKSQRKSAGENRNTLAGETRNWQAEVRIRMLICIGGGLQWRDKVYMVQDMV